MRRLLLLLTATASLVLGAGVGAAAAGPPRETEDVNCRPGTQCLFLKTGWQLPPGRRNLGG